VKRDRVYAVPKVFVDLAEIALRSAPVMKSARDRRAVADALKTIRRVNRRGRLPAGR
jgi:hypothetical protein